MWKKILHWLDKHKEVSYKLGLGYDDNMYRTVKIFGIPISFSVVKKIS